MILHLGERVYWGAPEVIYLEGAITSLDEQAQTAIVHIDRATTHSAHLIGTDIPFAADGLKPLIGDSPPGTTGERNVERVSPPEMNDDEKVRSAAAAAVHQQYGYNLDSSTETALIEQVIQTINSDSAMRKQIITSMNEILRREF
ncbi:MAG: hypothetical protein JO031_18780 [Ktedonobacteraceae bacterium]|nr:hypothetical protein [Ktedonobacteraceae bacterium]